MNNKALIDNYVNELKQYSNNFFDYKNYCNSFEELKYLTKLFFIKKYNNEDNFYLMINNINKYVAYNTELLGDFYLIVVYYSIKYNKLNIIQMVYMNSISCYDKYEDIGKKNKKEYFLEKMKNINKEDIYKTYVI